ncbi:MAG: LysR family transcriptional regulator [Acidobacteriota bacterium]|nr:LysR family transcriptional regulator [Acidobacteriota bacterium]
MDISIGDITVFREVARVGKVTAASRSLGLTQPTVSWTIKKLEDTLGAPLFLRSNRGVRLTRAGEAFLARSENLLQQWEAVNQAVQAEGEEVRGRVVLGVYGNIAAQTLPRFCGALLEAWPKLDLVLEHDLSRHIAEGVISHRIDFGIVVNPPQHPDLTILELYRDEIKFWVSQKPTALQDAAGEEGLLIVNPDLLQSETLIRQATKAGLVRCRRTLYTTDLEVNRALTASGIGVGILPETIARYRPDQPLIALPESPVYGDVICLVFRSDTQKGKTGLVVKESIVNALRS